MPNEIQKILCELKISSSDSITLYSPRVRDREDVAALKCKKSGVIFLSRTDHISLSHYEDQSDFNYWSASDRQRALHDTIIDDRRRCEQFRHRIVGKAWIDIGTGNGGILDLLGVFASKIAAVEPQSNSRKQLEKLGYTVFRTVEDAPETTFNIATLFHVLEHFVNPIETLNSIRKKLVDGGILIVEVPHAKDALLELYNQSSFKDFTLWSEHLILHTRESLKTFLEAAGFRNVHIEGFQRYPLANHLYWLCNDKPGGHVVWDFLNNPQINQAYADALAHLDISDTLIAIAEK